MFESRAPETRSRHRKNFGVCVYVRSFVYEHKFRIRTKRCFITKSVRRKSFQKSAKIHPLARTNILYQIFIVCEVSGFGSSSLFLLRRSVLGLDTQNHLLSVLKDSVNSRAVKQRSDERSNGAKKWFHVEPEEVIRAVDTQVLQGELSDGFELFLNSKKPPTLLFKTEIELLQDRN